MKLNPYLINESCEPMKTSTHPKPKIAVWKFASCDGCQLSLLDCEDELLALAGSVELAYFPEASRAFAEYVARRSDADFID